MPLYISKSQVFHISQVGRVVQSVLDALHPWGMMCVMQLCMVTML